MRILVTGGSGFIGSHLCESLVHQGHEVTSLDDYSTSSERNLKSLQKNPHFQIVKGSILDKELVRTLIKKSEVCFHFAAAVGVQKILLDPINSIKTNIHGSENVIEACVDFDSELILASTSEIYGKNPIQPLSEESDRVIGSPLLSRWTYSDAKAIDESLTHAYHLHRGLRGKIVRLFNTVGPRQSPAYGMVIPKFFEAAMKDMPIEIHGDGSQRRVFCHVEDAINGILAIWSTNGHFGEAFNVGGFEEVSILELARKIQSLTKSESKIKYIPYAELKKNGFEDMSRRIPCTEKLQNLSGWKALKSLDEILEDYYLYLRSK